MFHLVRFRQRVPRLEIENLGNTFVGEDVVTALDSLCEAKPQEKATQIPEADIRV